MRVKDMIIRSLRKAYRLFSKKTFDSKSAVTNRQQSNDIIYNLLVSDEPCMIARFGTTELITINNYLCIKSKEPFLRKIWNFISDHTHTPWWFDENIKYLEVFSGVFPANRKMSERFSERCLEDIPQIDILGSFQYYEKFMPLQNDVKLLHLETLYPFFVERPWTRVLKGKKVLVVHPFEDTIRFQYDQRKYLFQNEQILPEFELITIKAIQSAAGIKAPFNDWFEALEHMEKQISMIEFDICILGCGAYGLPLAAHVKRMGKKAIHLGGGLQLLFGIKGKRWDPVSNYGSWYQIPHLFDQNYCDLYNDKWIRPLDTDTPKNAIKLDGATYW